MPAVEGSVRMGELRRFRVACGASDLMVKVRKVGLGPGKSGVLEKVRPSQEIRL